MNKTKKIAFGVVSLVMAGTMALSLSACGDPEEGKGPNGGDGGISFEVKDEYGVLNEDGSINYDAYKRDSAVTLNLGIGHDSAHTSTAFAANLGSTITLPDGKQYSNGSFKPAWVQMGADLNITWKNVYQGWKTSQNLQNMLTNNDPDTNQPWYNSTDLFTSDLSQVVSYASSGTSILNLADYLDYMPNFKTFLLENPVVYLSLLQAGMNTTTGAGQTLYVAPYFDGYDDIERYVLIRQDWADTILNGDAALTGSTAWGKDTSVESYMAQTGKITVDALNAEGTATTKVVKNYDNVVTEIKKANSALNTAYKAIANAEYAGASGNIVDIMNAAIEANNGATGAQLVTLFRAYIDACYQKEDGTAFYSADSRSDLFNGYNAAWDVDDLVAMLRCVTTNASALGGNVGGIMPRSGANDRTPDMVRLAAQLYGVRGTESRYEYTYIDSEGEIQDARADKDMYEMVARFHLLKEEGLIADYSAYGDFSGSSGMTATADYFMMYDYSQTQTLNGFYAEDSTLTGTVVDDSYYFAPILTPVSKWDVDGDGNHTDIMRFTESWRSTKTGGLSLNGALANSGNEAKLKAALQFVDYLYSEDGQIVSTFGPMATNANGDGGFWYNEQATSAQVEAGEYFSYKGVKYSGSYYKGTYTPTITEDLYNSFKGKEVNGWQTSENSNVSKAKLSFTSYARMLIGSTLPVGVKNQSLEYQLTSKMGQVGCDKVGQALALGVIKGMSLQIDEDNYWYTCVPSGMPVANDLQTGVLDASTQVNFKYLTGTQKDGKNFFSIFNYIILNGATGTYNQQDVVVSFTSVDDLLGKTLGGENTISQLAQQRETVFQDAWETSLEYWDFISSSVETK